MNYFSAFLRITSIATLLSLFCFASCEKTNNGTDDLALATPQPKIQEGSLTRNSFTVKWEAVDNAVYYAYRIDGTINGRAYEPKRTISNLTAGTTYTVEVMAVADADSGMRNSAWSAPLSVTTSGGNSGGDRPDTDLAGYNLVWADEFDGQTLDMSSWNIEVNGNGGGNNELQYYREENVGISVEPVSGRRCLTLTARRESFGGRNATSGRINSKGKRFFKYGRFDALIKFPPTADGLWPAYWMMGNDYDEVDWPRCGEIDIIELGNATGIATGTQDRYFNGACHWGYYKDVGNGNWAYPNYANHVTYPYSIEDGEFHLVSCIWDEEYLSMYVDLDKYPDAEPYFRIGITETSDDWGTGLYFHKDFFILFNLAVGGNFTGIWNINGITALASGEQRMYVDYIRVYQKK